MTKEFIPYEQALELKKLGFDEQCYAWYNKNGVLLSDVSIGYESGDNLYSLNDMNDDGQCIAPLYQQAFRWFREKYGLVGLITIGTQEFSYDVYNIKEDVSELGILRLSYNNTYEEAELACLKDLFEIVKKWLVP